MGSDALCCDYKPSGSTCLEICRASEVARSVLAGVTAKIRHVSLVMNWNSMSLICASMSTGWSPTGTLVRPGRSIMVMFSTATHNHWLYIHLTDKFTSPKVTRNPTGQCLCHTTEEPRFYFLNNVFEWFPRFCMLFWKFLRPSPINKLFVLKKRSVFVLYLTKRLTIILPYYLTTFFVVSNKYFLKAIIQ